MSEELKSDSKRELPLRQNLVDTAVSFLLNPNVQQRPEDAKIAFLKKKGLTDSEINVAFNRAAESAVVSNEDRQLVNAYPLPLHYAPNSFWFQLRSYSSAFVSFAVAVYVIHRFYKSYIEPWLFGLKSEKSEIAAIKQQLVDLNNSVSQLTTSVASLEETVSSQILQIDRASALYGGESIPKSVREIVDEMGNVKSLLLNRFSFPAPPVMAGATSESKTQNGDSRVPPKVVSIPKWQLRDSEQGKSKEESETKENSSESASQEECLSSVEQTQDQENKLHTDKIQDETSKIDSGNNVGALENITSTDGKIQNEDSEAAVENELNNVEEKTLDEDSGIESHNCVSDSESTDQVSGPNEKDTIQSD